MVMAECRAKHLKFTFCKSIEMQVLCFWCSTDSGGMPFQTFHVSIVLHFLCWLHIEHIWVFTCLYFPKYVLEFLHKIYEWELCFEYIWGPISKRFAGVNMFWRCLTAGFFKEHFRYIFICTHISQHIFYETFWDIFQKRFLEIRCLPVRCCKNPIDFLWSIVMRCLLEDVLLQIFGIFVYTPEICLRNIIADIRKNLLRNIWGDWPKPVLRNCFQRYLQ